MELQLRALISGQVHTFRSHRLLKLDHEPIAYVVPHADGWRLFALNPEATVAVNQILIEYSVVLMVGDAVTIGRVKYIVEAVDTSDVPGLEAGREDTICRVTSDFDELGKLVPTQIVLGTHPDCGFILPTESGDKSRRALLARVQRRWLLYDFQHRSQPGEAPKMPWTPIRDDDVVELEGARLSFSILTAEEAAAYGERDTVNYADTDRDLDVGAVVGDDFSDSADRAETEPTIPTTFDPLAPLMIQVCLWLKKAIKDHQPGVPQNVPFELPPGEASAKQLNALLRKTAMNPRDRIALSNLAEFARQGGYLQARRMVVREMCKLDPDNQGLMIAYVEACYEASRLPELSVEDRLVLLKEAEKYADKLSEKGCRSPELQDLRRSVASDRIINLNRM